MHLLVNATTSLCVDNCVIANDFQTEYVSGRNSVERACRIQSVVTMDVPTVLHQTGKVGDLGVLMVFVQHICVIRLMLNTAIGVFAKIGSLDVCDLL